VDSLGVPMSPGLGNVRHRTPIAQGLISTERTQPKEPYPPAFLCIGTLTIRLRENFIIPFTQLLCVLVPQDIIKRKTGSGLVDALPVLVEFSLV
jgi:hypothetical protein